MSPDACADGSFEARIPVSNRKGFHLRAATLFVKEAQSFASTIMVHAAQRKANGKGILDLLTLGATCGTEILIRASGSDAKEAVAALGALVADKFKEVE